jgi:hypothetical protein
LSGVLDRGCGGTGWWAPGLGAAGVVCGVGGVCGGVVAGFAVSGKALWGGGFRVAELRVGVVGVVVMWYACGTPGWPVLGWWEGA